MRNPTDAEIVRALIRITTDGFNRSMGVLVDAGAIKKTKKMREGHRPGGKYYELVTEQLEYTAKSSIPEIRKLFSEDPLS